MSRTSIALWALALLGCNDAPVHLFVDLRTDLVPGRDFYSVQTALDGERRTTIEAPSGEDDGSIHLFRAAEFDALAPGTYLVEVALRDITNAELARAGVRVTLATDTVVPVVILESCLGVRCPPLLVCADGACVEPPCPPGDPMCAVGECASDADCAVAHECARGRCDDGSCVAVADDARCQADQRCDLVDGCVGSGLDAGRPDAGTADGGSTSPTDAGRDGGPTCDPASCGPNEGCCPGIAGCVDLTTDARCGSCSRACPSDQRCLHEDAMGREIEPYCTRCDPDACGAFGAICCPHTAPAATCTAWFSDPNHCGGCGQACPSGQNCVTHAEPLFTGPFCTACNPDDCAAFGVGCCPDSAPSTACTNWFEDPNNCGGCNVRCPSGQNCVTHTSPDFVAPFCTQCNPDDCAAFGVGCCPDSAPSTACTNWFVDENNCGGCGRRCPAGQTCSSGTCG